MQRTVKNQQRSTIIIFISLDTIYTLLRRHDENTKKNHQLSDTQDFDVTTNYEIYFQQVWCHKRNFQETLTLGTNVRLSFSLSFDG